MTILGVTASSQFISRVSYDSISTVTVGAGGVSNVEFTSIPSTYTHLQIRAYARTNRANNDDQLKISFNADTAANYTAHQLYADRTTPQSFGLSSAALNGQFGMVAAGAASANNVFGASIVDIIDYANTNKNKVIRCFCGVDWNTGGYTIFNSTTWLNTSAITSIKLVPANGTTISQYSSIALYGIRS